MPGLADPVPERQAACFPTSSIAEKPGVIGVLADGRRFVNEALGYHDYTLAMIEQVPDGDEVCSVLVADQRCLRYFPLGMAKPFPIPTWPYVRSGYLSRGRTVGELAEKVGIDPDGSKTVADFHEGARHGEDPEFGRGSTPFNVGPATQTTRGPTPRSHRSNKSLLCGRRWYPRFGTFAGLVTDASRVLDNDDQPIDGCSPGSRPGQCEGGHYPSGGINLGPAMTFGYLTGRLLASTPGTPDDLPTRAGRPDGPRYAAGAAGGSGRRHGFDTIGLRLLPAAPGTTAYPLHEDHTALDMLVRRLEDSPIEVFDLEIIRLDADFDPQPILVCWRPAPDSARKPSSAATTAIAPG